LVLNYSNERHQINKQRKFSIINRFLGSQDPRIDFDNPFLSDMSTYLDASEFYTYTIVNKFYKAKNYEDILDLNNIQLDFTPDYVIIELPSIIDNNHPAELFTHSDMDILVCRANRLWSEADQSALNRLLPLSDSKMNFIVNGVELSEVESLLGELPKKRSKFRKKIKNIFKFQFFSENQL